MVFKLVKEAEKTWKRIKGHMLIPKLLEGATFVNGDPADTGEQVA
jgi:hypothetical protein